MLPVSCLVLITAASRVAATNLFVSSYSGFVKTLSLQKQSGGSYNLTSVATDRNCGTSPSWLTVGEGQPGLLCVNEGLTTINGSITSYARSRDGKLKPLAESITIGGPVNAQVYGTETRVHGAGLAVALPHYSTGALSTFSMTKNGHDLKPLQSFTFTLPFPGPYPGRQDSPHPHEAVLDPTRRFIFVPDLGADAIRIFRIDAATNLLTALKPYKVAPGSGPRHAAFWSPRGARASSPLYLYVVTELANTLTGYAVTYLAGGRVKLKQVYATNTFGGSAIPPGAAAAEIKVTPDNRFLIVSNRNDSSFSIPKFRPMATGDAPSDSLATFRLQRDGSLAFCQLSPAGGSFPRNFAINKAGTLVAVGLQLSHRVVIIARDVATGLLGNFVAFHHVKGQVTSVAWDH